MNDTGIFRDKVKPFTLQRGFFIPGLPNPYFLLAAGIAIVVSFGLGYWKGYSGGMENYYTLKGEYETEQEKIRLKQEIRENELNLMATRAASEWERVSRQLDHLKRNPPVRVRSANCPSGEVPAVPAPSGEPAELRTGEQGLGAARTITAEECEARLNAGHNNVIWIEQVKKLTDELHEGSKK